MRININGFWENETPEGHLHDDGIAKGLVDFFLRQPRDAMLLTVLDAGCGDAYYTNFLRTHQIHATGVDGNPYTKEISYSEFVLPGVDLTQPLSLGLFNWVLCLEVGEHIPKEREDVFLDNLNTHNKDGIIISWAVENQGGDGHINCHNNDYVIEKITKLGYKFDNKETELLRSKAAKYPKPCYWFRDTIMIFFKDNK